MFRGSLYHLSQASLEYFANAFNAIDKYQNIRWEFIRGETFKNDGWFINLETGETFGFDWEIRDDHWEDGKFPFPTLGQYERKFDKTKAITLSVQANKKCSSIVVAWHEDFAEEETVNIQLATDNDIKENSKTRYTKHFIGFKYDEMLQFKKLIYKAFETKTYNHKVFDVIMDEKNDTLSQLRVCPQCGKQMLLKKNKKDNSLFWGCSGYKFDNSGCNYTERN